MSIGTILRFVILGILWLALVYYIVTHAAMTFTTWFSILASAIIVFVPMYKKYVRDKKD